MNRGALVNALRCCVEADCTKCLLNKQGDEQTTVEECSSKLAGEALGYILYLEEELDNVARII